MAAEHQEKRILLWGVCSTCHQPFCGAVGLELAKAHLSRVQGRREKFSSWVEASMFLGNALSSAGKFAEAEADCRETFAAFERAGLPTNKVGTALLHQSLANALCNQGKHADAEVIFERIVKLKKRAFGADSQGALQTAVLHGNSLAAQGKHAKATVVLRKTFENAKQALGPENTTSLSCASTLAAVLTDQGQYAEAETLFKEFSPVLRRVVGPDHVEVLTSTLNYALCLQHVGRLDEAEAMLVGNLEALQRVWGAEQELTLNVTRVLASVRNDIAIQITATAPKV